MTRAKMKRMRRIEKQEADSQAWWEEHKDDEFFDAGDDGFGTQLAYPLVFFFDLME